MINLYEMIPLISAFNKYTVFQYLTSKDSYACNKSIARSPYPYEKKFSLGPLSIPYLNIYHVFIPAILNGHFKWGHIVSPLSLRTSVCPVRSFRTMVSVHYLLKICIGSIFHTQVYNHKIQAQFDFE